jgi:hypothetical protein
MSRVKTLQNLFKRYRRPGDIVFATAFLILSLLLLSQIFAQTAHTPDAKLFAQPRFWPAVSLVGMSGFALLHLLGSLLSERIEGRWREVGLWIASLEYALWFILYALSVPVAGYLPATVIFALLLVLRAGYRSVLALFCAAATALIVVVLFRALLHVNMPAGRFYDQLPDGLRQIMLTYF